LFSPRGIAESDFHARGRHFTEMVSGTPLVPGQSITPE
jgi:hypothetical protein